ncbi:MAG: hypothetical protein ACJ796_19710 [Gemmatimonadaceae bacterium]
MSRAMRAFCQGVPVLRVPYASSHFSTSRLQTGVSLLRNFMVNVRPLHPRASFDSRQRVGDLVVEVARRYAAQMNGCEFATLLRSRRLDRRRYVAFIASFYPCVIGFNRALIRSIAKDHVLHSSFIKSRGSLGRGGRQRRRRDRGGT